MTDVPPNWVPFIPVRLPGSTRQVGLVEALLPRSDGSGDPVATAPLSSVLQELKGLVLPEEEVPAAGVTVRRRWFLARSADGGRHAWARTRARAAAAKARAACASTWPERSRGERHGRPDLPREHRPGRRERQVLHARAPVLRQVAGATIVDAPATGQTIEGILADLATRDTLQDTINIVCRPTGVGALALPLTAAGQAAGATITTADDVQKAIANKTLAPPAATVVADTTRVVVLHGADIGRSTTFLMRLASLFGNPGELLAPRRLSVFTSDGSGALYRQAQTWTRVGVEPLIPDGADEPSGGWPAFRTQFVSDLALLFGPAAVLAEDGGDATLTMALTAAADGATRTIQAPGFFFESGFDILPSGALSAQQVAENLQPIANGDPVTAAAASAAEVDDTALVTTVTFADAFALDAAQDRYAIRVVQLAQLIDADVPIAEGPGYARATSSAGLAPAAGSGTAGGGDAGSSAADDRCAARAGHCAGPDRRRPRRRPARRRDRRPGRCRLAGRRADRERARLPGDSGGPPMITLGVLSSHWRQHALVDSRLPTERRAQRLTIPGRCTRSRPAFPRYRSPRSRRTDDVWPTTVMLTVGPSGLTARPDRKAS